MADEDLIDFTLTERQFKTLFFFTGIMHLLFENPEDERLKDIHPVGCELMELMAPVVREIQAEG